MAFTSFEELSKLSDDVLATEILEAKKQLFELRLQRATRQSFKSHSFKHLKRKVAQLLTIESSRKN
jgi:large subunit ribosomal protein L29